MFSKGDLQGLDPAYFEIVIRDAYDIVIISRNTRHIWHLHSSEYPTEGAVVIFHSHVVNQPYHIHGREKSLKQALRSIKEHDLYQLNGRRPVTEK